jgi:uncharacterized protein (UPF0335 family)
MEINAGLASSADAKDNVNAFAVRLLNLMNAKKQIDADIKALKTEFSEQGCAVGVVQKSLQNIMKNKKMTESQIFELETIQSWLEQNKEVDDSIVEYLSKS